MITISVDDQENTAQETAKMMDELDPGGEHVAFPEVKPALEYAKKNKPDVAWLDIEMPGMSGLKLLCNGELSIRKLEQGTEAEIRIPEG